MTEKRMAELWNSSAGPKYFLLRGSFDVGRAMDIGRLRMLTKNKAHITTQSARQICELWDCKVEHFCPPLLPGTVPTAMPAQVHLATLAEVLMTSIEYGMGAAPEICAERVKSLRRELELVVKRVDAYRHRHYTLLAPFPVDVRNLLVEAINHGMDDWFHAVAMQADELQGAHPDGAPPPGTADSVIAPKFMRLKNLTEPHHPWSLEERARTWEKATPSAGDKRKAAAAPSKAPTPKRKTKKSGAGYLPSGACRTMWLGDPCHRAGCPFWHVDGSTYAPNPAPSGATSLQPQPPQLQQTQPEQGQQRPQQQPQLQQPQPQLQQGQSKAVAEGEPRQANVANFGKVAGGGREGAGRKSRKRGTRCWPEGPAFESPGSSPHQGWGGSQTELVPCSGTREVRGTSRCTDACVSSAGPVPR